MNAARWHAPGRDSRYAECFVLSVLLHGAVIGLAVVSFSDLRLASQPDAFRWRVSMVGTTNQPSGRQVRATPAGPPIAPAAPVPSSIIRQKSRPTSPMAPSFKSGSAPTILSRTDTTPPPASADTATPSPSASTPAQDTADASIEPPAPTVSGLPVNEPEPNAQLDASMDARTLDTPVAPPAMTSPQPFDAGSNVTSTASLQTTAPPANLASATTGKPDFSWLTTSLRNRVQESQQYSTVARLNGLEGRVVLRIAVKDNGTLLVSVAQSSGHALLDQDAVEQVTRLSPLPLLHPLGRPQQVLNLPIIYSLNR